MSFILAAIDGTWSASEYNTGYETATQCVYNRSFVRRFYEAASIERKFFIEGPNLTGSNVGNILEEAWNFLRRSLSIEPNAQVALIGHSRGGHIATALAIRLSQRRIGDFQPSISTPGWRNPNPTQPVQFLGLYDAVDRTANAGGDTTVVPANVIHFRHAIRSPALGSRTSFSNTATRAARTDRENYHARHFDATHGAIGGSVPHGCDTGFAFGGDYCNYAISEADNTRIGEQADRYIIAGAKAAGVPI